MAYYLNRVTLIGIVGSDPEIRAMQGGGRFATLSLATTEAWRDKASGERRERTEWHRVAIFNEHHIEIADKYLQKGSRIYIEGSLQTRKWHDQSGQERRLTEIVLTRYRGELGMLDARGGASTTDLPPGMEMAAAGRDLEEQNSLSGELSQA